MRRSVKLRRWRPPHEVANVQKYRARNRVPHSGAGVCRAVWKSGGADVQGCLHHEREARGAGNVFSARRSAGRSRRTRRLLQRSSRVLPRRGHADAEQRFRHQSRSLAAGERLEREVSGGRQRRLGRRDQLFRDGGRRPRRVCDRVNRHRACRRPRRVCARPSGEADRLLLALGT